ncbi:MAG: DUF393 domain-containing protein [Pseudomonadota bacterium]|nr:MAG: hypothetical protein DIU72_01870 [Pseudomonadota bacterium]
MLQPHQLLLVYDGKCGFCSSVARVLRRLDWRGRIYTLPFQIEGLPEEMGSSLREARRTALALTPSGKLWRGAGSAAASFDMLLPFGLPLFRLLYSLPGLHQLGDFLYGWVSRHRRQLTFTYADLRHKKPPVLDEGTRAEIRRRRLATRMPSALTAPSATLY